MNYQAGDIPSSTMTSIVLSLLICIIVPIIIIFICKKKLHTTLRTVIYGMMCYLIFSMVLEQALHSFILGFDWPVADFISSHGFAYAIYGALTAGIFEEIGRYFMFTRYYKDFNDYRIPIMFGLGHGGIECILIGGMAMFSTLLMAIVLNQTGSELYLAEFNTSIASNIEPTITALFEGSSIAYLVSGFERIMTLCLQISLTVLVYVSVQYRDYKYYLPLAIAIHAIVDFPAALYQFGTITNVFFVEMWIAIATVATCYFAYRIMIKLYDKEINKEE